MAITELLVHTITSFISQSGYLGVCVLMVFESMVVPVPSEAVMPFAGYLITTGRFTFLGLLLASTLGSIIGSLLGYAIGAYGGRPFLQRWGKYFLLNHHHLELTEKFFQSRGSSTIFISRLIPVVRHLISIPAGIGRMPMRTFIPYTIVGAALWNGFLTYVGLKLGQHWDRISAYTHVLDYSIVSILLMFIGIFIYRQYRSRAGRV